MRSLHRAAVAAAAGLALLLLSAMASLAQPRFALVIGNGAYMTAPLANPKNDAELMAKTLRQLGFEVTKQVDVDQKGMRRALLEFGRKLKAAEAVGVFYYAGHGVQLDGENYLIPVGAEINEAREIPVEAVNFGEVLKTFDASSRRIAIAILDACRNNPFAASSRDGTRGLASMNAPSGTLISYATAPGQVALDGDGANSPFAEALARSMQQVGLPVEDVFKRTRRQVLAKTAERQTPWESSSLVGDFYFRPKTGAQEPSSPDLARAVDAARLAEIAEWEQIKSSRSRRDFERHLARYPAGVFAEVARWRLQQLSPDPRVASPAWGWTITGETGASIRTGSTERGAASQSFEQALQLDRPGATGSDLEQAARLYATAADAGIAAAMHNLARLYEYGTGVPKDPVTAITLFRRAATAGFAPAMSALGALYEFGDGVAVDLVEAVRLYRMAAEQGDLAGMTSLGYLHAAGKGVAKDFAAARRWYGIAAERGYPRAQFNLALMELRGEGQPADAAKALRYFEAAAAGGHAGAMREIASLHDEGRAVKRDPRRAAEMLLLAYKGGSEAARQDISTKAEAWRYTTRREIQSLLKAWGHYDGPNTGWIDKKTRAAIEAYARAPK